MTNQVKSRPLPQDTCEISSSRATSSIPCFVGMGERGSAVFDIFRVRNGKLEHWDVLQAVPETAANKNTMF